MSTGETEKQAQERQRKSRAAAFVIAGTAVFWVLALLVGGEMGASNRLLALFDLMALAGFVFGLFLAWQIWRYHRPQGK